MYLTMTKREEDECPLNSAIKKSFRFFIRTKVVIRLWIDSSEKEGWTQMSNRKGVYLLCKKNKPYAKRKDQGQTWKGKLRQKLWIKSYFNFNNEFIDFSRSTNRILDNQIFNHLVMKISFWIIRPLTQHEI